MQLYVYVHELLFSELNSMLYPTFMGQPIFFPVYEEGGKRRNMSGCYGQLSVRGTANLFHFVVKPICNHYM